jgi:hypothetical protein
MRDVSLTLSVVGGTAAPFECDAHLCEIQSEAGDVVTYQTLCADGSFSQSGRSKYALHVVAVQDWSATGLARFLWDNEGELAEFTYQAHGDATVVPSDSAPGMAGTVTLIAPNYGGEAEAYAELEVTMPCASKPTLATAAFPAGTASQADADLAAAEATEAIDEAEAAAAAAR